MPAIYSLDPTDDPEFSTPCSVDSAAVILTRTSPVDASLISRARNCFIIIILGSGAGPSAPRIDLEAARHAGIYVTSIPDYDSDAYAVETIQLCEEALSLIGRDLKGKNLRFGIIGLGQVGRRVAALAANRGAQLWSYDPFCAPNPFDVLGVQPAPLEELLGMAHIVSLHVPIGPATRGMLCRERLSWIQPDTILINSSAPELIDLDALSDALHRKRPAVVAFNTDLSTILPASHPLLSCKNLIHRAAAPGKGAAAESNLLRRAQEIIDAALHGQRPKHLLIDPPCPRHALWQIGGATAQL